MAEIVITGLTKIYDNGAVAVQDLNLTVADGEFLVLVGPSGCGKSTVLRCLAGLEPLTSGTIAIDGRVINDLPPQDRDLAMVFQTFALYPHMTVFDNLAFGLKMRRLPKDELEQRVQWVAAKLGLTEHLQKKPRQLSGGEQQRVLLARALAQDTPVLLLDEPTTHLDLQHRESLIRLIRDLAVNKGLAILMVLHDLNLAALYSDRVALLVEGCLRAIGAPSEVITGEGLSDVYGIPVRVIPHPDYGSPLVLPDGRGKG